MRAAKIGDTVSVHYTGTLDDGTEFDSSIGREPIQVNIGDGDVIPGFENALVGMSEGDTKSVTMAPEDAYGPHIADLVHEVGRDQIPAEIDLEVGTALGASDQEGNQIRLLVIALSEDTATLDANHPLAGKALTFELQLVGFVG